MNIRNTAFAALIFVVIYNILLFQTGFGIGTGLFFLLLNIYFFYIKNSEGRNLNLALISSVLSIVFSFMFVFRGNGFVQLIDLAATAFFALTSLYFYKYSGQITFGISNFLWLPFLIVEKSMGGLFGLLIEPKIVAESTVRDNNSSLIRGVLITLPILGVLLFLLTQADPIFNKITRDIFQNIGERSVVSAIIFTVLIGFGLAKFLDRISERNELAVSAGKPQELIVIAGSIIGLFGVFILIQFRYLFMSVGERELSQLGITSLTYSEYVRKGFFELLIAASIAGGVIAYIFKYLHHLKDIQKSLVQVFAAALTVETGLLLLSDIKRLALYADAHGLTRARIFGFIFLVWLAALLVIFLIRVFRELKEKEFFTSTAFITLAVFGLINIINIDGLIAQKYKPTVNGETDYYYLTSLSTDARPVWIESIADAEQTLTRLESLNEISTEDNRKLYWISNTINQLNSKVGDIIDKYGTLSEIRSWHKDDGTFTRQEQLKSAKNEEDLPQDVKRIRKWQAFNLSEYQAYREVADNMAVFGRIPGLLNRMATLSSKVSNEVQRNTRLDRSTQAPLLR